MRNKIYLMLIVVLLLGLLSACSSIGGSSANQAVVRQMTVTGTGKITLTPNLAYISVGVHTEMADVNEALASNTSQAQKVADALKSLNVEAKDIQTTSFNVYPQKNYGPNGEVLDTIYVVDNSVYITVRDLSKLGQILSAVVSSGANNINGINFDISNREEAISQARKAAIDDAKKQADELAKAAGVTLGPVQTLYISSNPTPLPVYEAKGGASMSASANVPVSAGQMIIQIDVSITYALK
jgi:uncharacterized protein YggE